MDDLAATEKVRSAERQIAIVRSFVVLINTLVYLLLMDKAGTLPWLAAAVIAVAFLYSGWVLWREPYRRYALLLSSYFTTATDALLIIVWVLATGGIHSPFYILLYLSISAVAFRYAARETAAATAIYAGSYLGLLLALGQVGGHAADVTVRLSYIGLFGLLSGLMSREVLRQTRFRVELAEQLNRETELAGRRSRFLADASATLAGSLDWEEIPTCIARLMVPMLGDNCVVDVIDEDGSLRRQGEASVYPAKEELLRQLRAFPVPDEASPVRRALATGQTVFIPQFDDAALGDLKRGDAYTGLVRAIGPTSSITIPMRGRDRMLGALSFGMGGSGRAHDPADLALAEELARHAALAIDNARLYREATQAIQARDTFLSIASHELKTPLTTLVLQADGLLRQSRGSPADGLDSMSVIRRADKMVQQTHRLDRLINQLLDVSRITSGHLDLDLKQVDLAGVVNEVVTRFSEDLASAGSTLSVSNDGGAVIGRWDPMRLDQIVTNLVSNAIKYGRGGTIDVALAVRGGRARFAVTDHGIGIDKAHQRRLFQRFERMAGKDAPGGIGLGLWITRQFVVAMEGSITVESDLGQGATFAVELPTRADGRGDAPGIAIT
jgi:signal transduction histidine kinase